MTATPPADVPESVQDRAALKGMPGQPPGAIQPGACLPWDRKLEELPPVTGDTVMMRRVWEQTDGLANMFIWQLLLSF